MNAQKLWQVRLLLKGVGWRASLIAAGGLNSERSTLLLHVGYSHPVTLPVPQGVQITCTPSSTGGYQISANSNSAVVLGNYVATIQRVRPWSPYTGHGIVKMYTVPAPNVYEGAQAQEVVNRQGTSSLAVATVGVRVPKPSRRKIGKRK